MRESKEGCILYVCIYIYISIYSCRGREVERDSEREREREAGPASRSSAIGLAGDSDTSNLNGLQRRAGPTSRGRAIGSAGPYNACRRCAMDGVSVFLGRPGEPGAGGIAISVNLASG